MNTLSDLIKHLESEPYYFVGSYWSGNRAEAHALPFECDCEFTHDAAALVVEGVYRPHAGATQHPFELRLDLQTQVLHAAPVKVSTPALGTIEGKVVFLSGFGVFIGRNASAAASAQVSVSERDLISVSGAVETGGRYFGYSVKGAVVSNRATLSNVVGIRAPRRT
jgi:hypothetical protein